MELESLIQDMDNAAANLEKLTAIWERAAPMIPRGANGSSSTDYEDLQRAWIGISNALPPIDGFTISARLPDIDDLVDEYAEAFFAGLPTHTIERESLKAESQLAEYRFRLHHARRKAIRERLSILSYIISQALPSIIKNVPRDSREVITNDDTETVSQALREIEQLLGNTLERTGRWQDMRRHLLFGQGHDWHDISERDWPQVKHDIESAYQTEMDPLPVRNLDLGEAAESKLSGGVSPVLQWNKLTPDSFERLIFDLLQGWSSYEDVELLLKTESPDQGRDLSAYRVSHHEDQSTSRERVIIQAKHWITRSVGPEEIDKTLTRIKLLESPVVDLLIVVTSGRFTADAVRLKEKRNNSGKLPKIDLWADTKLESLLSLRPDLIAKYGLKKHTS